MSPLLTPCSEGFFPAAHRPVPRIAGAAQARTRGPGRVRPDPRVTVLLPGQGVSYVSVNDPDPE